MIDVERLRTCAIERKRERRVGMVLSCDQVLELIARGDAQQAQPAYRIRIEDLEGEVERLRRGDESDDEPDEDPDDDDGEWADLVRVDEAVELLGVPYSTLSKQLRNGMVYGRRRREQCADGIPRQVWYVDVGEARAYAELSHADKIAVRRNV